MYDVFRRSALSLLAGNLVAIPCSLAQSGPGEELDPVVASPVGFPASPVYGDRAIGITYDNLSSTFGQSPGRWGSIANHQHILEDISFVPGPWATQATRLATTMTIGRWRAFGGPYAGDYVFTFWDKDDVLFAGFAGTGTGMINAGAVPLASVRVAFTNQNSTNALGTGSQTTVSLTGLPGGGVTFIDDSFFLEVAVVEPGTNTLLLTDTLRTVIASNSTAPTGGNAATVGTTIRDLGWDADRDGVFLGQPGFGTPERYSYSWNSMAAGYMFRISGDILPQPPANPINLACIADTGVARTGDSVADASALWYQFCLNGAATDAAYQFLNIDTEGSAANVSMGVFDSNGILIASDTDSGSGTQAQLSFGIGRAAAVGDGLQYDGRHGQLAAGNYYLAIAPHGSTFGDGYTAIPSGTGGAVSLNMATNTNGSAPAASVVPIINQVNFDSVAPGGPIQFPDARPGTSVATGLRGVMWNTFEITAEAGSGSSILDLDFAGRSGVGFDSIAYLFDANGNVVAFSNNDGPNNFPQFSFGAGAGPRTYGANPVQFTGANGNLPAGRYYVAIALVAVQTLNGHPNGARWHLRGTSASNGNVGFDIFTDGTPASPCDGDVNCDFALDGFDVETQEKAVGGDLTDYCQPDPDFNGDFALDGFDVEAVEIVTGGGPCP